MLRSGLEMLNTTPKRTNGCSDKIRFKWEITNE